MPFTRKEIVENLRMSYVTLNTTDDGDTNATFTDSPTEIAELKAQIETLQEALREAMEWNWLDEDMNIDIEQRLRKLL